MEAREFLKRYQIVRKRCETLRRRIDDLDDELGTISINMDGMPHGTTTSDTVARYVATLEMLRAELASRELEQDVVREEIEEVLSAMDDGLANLLRLRYICRWSWLGIADRMDYSADHCKGYLRGKALAAFDLILREKENGQETGIK